MRRAGLPAPLSMLGAAAMAPAPAEPPGSAAQFVQQLYRRYPLKEGEISGALGANSARWFTRPLLPLLVRDNAAVAATHLIGRLDWDPLCECQDDDGFRLLAVRTETETPDVAIVTARIRLPLTPGLRGRNEASIRFVLLRTARGWRIADLGDPADRSLDGRSLAAKLSAAEP